MFTYEEISEVLLCNPSTGRFFWLPRPRSMFLSEEHQTSWNKENAWSECEATINENGYKVIYVLGFCILAHRAAWLLYYGKWPENIVDHINGDRGENKKSNLRDVSHAENMKNRRIPSHNKSGIMGVHWHKASSRWRATIGVDGSVQYIGSFSNLGDAANARKEAEIEYGFHANHGRENK